MNGCNYVTDADGRRNYPVSRTSATGLCGYHIISCPRHGSKKVQRNGLNGHYGHVVLRGRLGMKLKPDTRLRNQLMAPASYAHPAKGHLGLWWEIIERYTKPGDWVLDPMAGVGSTLLAALMGRNVVCVELEGHFVRPMLASWEKMRQHGPILGCELGQVVIVQGDTRALPLVAAGAVITSPPYEGSAAEGPSGIDWTKQADGRRKQEPHGVGCHPWGYTRPQAIVTSPPYEEAQSGGGIAAAMSGRGNYKITTGKPGSIYSSESHNFTDANIGNLRGSAYWGAMRQVYSECLRVLALGGVMVLVLKGFTRKKKYVDLPEQTRELCETLGFTFVEKWARDLALSFFRTLQKQNHPESWDDRLMQEWVYVFRKGPVARSELIITNYSQRAIKRALPEVKDAH